MVKWFLATGVVLLTLLGYQVASSQSRLIAAHTFVDNVTSVDLQNNPRWILKKEFEDGSVRFDVLDLAARRVLGDQEEFVPQGAAIKAVFFQLPDGRIARDCYLPVAPDPGVFARNGVVNPWFQEVIRGGNPPLCAFDFAGSITQDNDLQVAMGPSIVETQLQDGTPLLVKLNKGIHFPFGPGGGFSFDTQPALDALWVNHRAVFLSKFPDAIVLER